MTPEHDGLEPGAGDRAFLIDAGAIVVVSAAICVAADQLVLMSVLVPVVFVVRCALWLALPASERPLGPRAEFSFLAGCTVLGAFNDWNSVSRHRIYDYTVPAEWPELSLIPIWMLLYWGLILRFVATLFRWRRLRLPAAPAEVGVGALRLNSPGLRVAVALGLVFVTRQAIYRLYLDPVASWLPFALALGLAIAVLRVDRRRLALLGVFALGGPAVEVLYIQVGGLHAYHLGWLGGVPLWIAIWWVLAALIWGELSARAEGLLRRWLGAPLAPAH